MPSLVSRLWYSINMLYTRHIFECRACPVKKYCLISSNRQQSLSTAHILQIVLSRCDLLISWNSMCALFRLQEDRQCPLTFIFFSSHLINATQPAFVFATCGVGTWNACKAMNTQEVMKVLSPMLSHFSIGRKRYSFKFAAWQRFGNRQIGH